MQSPNCSFYKLTLLICLSLTHFTPYAQTLGPVPSEVQVSFDNGITALKAQGYSVAISYFQDALRNAPKSSAIYPYVGIAESKIPGRELRAICWYGAFLSATPNASVSTVTKVKAEMDRLLVVNQSNLSNLIKEAQNAASVLPNPDSNLWSVMNYWARTGDFSAAGSTVELIHDPSIKGKALMDLAEHQANANDLLGAMNSYRSALNNEDFSKASYVSTQDAIAKAQARTGDIVSALSMANSLHTINLDDRDEAIAGVKKDIAMEQAKAGDIAGALKTAALIPEGMEFRGEAECEIAKAQVEAGDVSGARTTLVLAKKSANMNDDGITKNDELNTIAIIQMKIGDIAAAHEIWDDSRKAADLIQSENGSNTAVEMQQSFELNMLLSEATNQIKAGAIAEAQKTWAYAFKIAKKNKGVLYIRFAEIAVAQAEAGDMSDAQKTVQLIDDAYEKNEALTKIDKAQRRIEVDAANPIAKVKVSEWLNKLNGGDDSSPDCRLNTDVFLDLSDYFKAITPPKDPQNPHELSDKLNEICQKMILAQSIIIEMMKR
ncbi:MAG TPA: hypothetical protein VNV15_05030 [Opitutaceae bacterium]|jgi:tetratricopeptide (TPR) repeat protein|nr:hypothetical protein [Opitutaceae bacterium]